MRFVSHEVTYYTLASMGILISVISYYDAYAVCDPGPCIVFDYAEYFRGHMGLINITDNSLDPAITPTISATIRSESDTGNVLTFPLDYIADPANPKTYQSVFINFTTVFDATNYKLKTSYNDPDPSKNRVKASYSSVDQFADIKNPQLGSIVKKTTAQPNLTYKATCAAPDVDTDGDKLCDSWEDASAAGPHPNSLKVTYSGIDYLYYCGTSPTDTTKPLGTLENPDPVCPKTDKKDVFLETDYMKVHKPNKDAIADLVAAFASAPAKKTLGGSWLNPDHSRGINLHVQVDEGFDIHKDYTTAPVNGANNAFPTDFDKLKTNYFGTSTDRSGSDSDISNRLTAKRQVFHYAIFTHFQTGNKLSSGKSEQPGNDMVISLGAFTGTTGNRAQQAGTLMHELGHNLNLYHGGSVNVNCKPNYLSVMSYTRQFPDFISDRQLNYSYGILAQLEKTTLNEPLNVTTSLTTDQSIVYGGPGTSPPITPLRSKIPLQGDSNPDDLDWNRNGNPSEGAASAAINYFGVTGCTDSVDVNPILQDYNDWNGLLYNMQTTTSWNDGANMQEVEIKKINYVTSTEPSIEYVGYEEGAPQQATTKYIAFDVVPKMPGLDADKDKILEEAKKLNDTTGFWDLKKEKVTLWIPIPPDNYTLPEELTLAGVREFRLQNMNALEALLMNVAIQNFSEPTDRDKLLEHIANTKEYIRNDNLRDAAYEIIAFEKLAYETIDGYGPLKQHAIDDKNAIFAVMPEFGSMVSVIFLIAVISILAFSTKTKLRLKI